MRPIRTLLIRYKEDKKKQGFFRQIPIEEQIFNEVEEQVEAEFAKLGKRVEIVRDFGSRLIKCFFGGKLIQLYRIDFMYNERGAISLNSKMEGYGVTKEIL